MAQAAAAGGLAGGSGAAELPGPGGEVVGDHSLEAVLCVLVEEEQEEAKQGNKVGQGAHAKIYLVNPKAQAGTLHCSC